MATPPAIDYSHVFWTALGGSATAMLVLGALFGYLIQHQYNKRLEDYKNELDIRKRAAGVAELLSVRFSSEYTPERFNRLAWELSLWLPADIVEELTKCLCGTEDAKHPKEILIMVRKILLGAKDTLSAPSIVHRDSKVQFTEKQRDKAEEVFASVVAVQMALGAYYNTLMSLRNASGDRASELKTELRETVDLVIKLDRELLALQIRTGYYFDKTTFELVTEFRNASMEGFSILMNHTAHAPAQIVDACKPATAAREKLAARYRELQ